MSLADFQILQKIGEGAYSTVHKVKRLTDGKVYALKQVKMNSLKQKQKQNALNQVRLLASISCEYIIKYKQSFFDQKSSTLCIIIEYAQNGDLQKLILKNKQQLKWVPQNQIWKMAKHILFALSVLHQKNIIHRDLKSANIFLTKGQYKIADLNVSKLLKHSLAYTQTGTPYYASPQVWQDKPYQLKSDIWSLGCILYEASALRPPFTATSMDGLYKKVMKGVCPRLPASYSQRLQNFISRCLQINPIKRPSSKQLMSMLPQVIPEQVCEQHSNSHSQINLLSTIKVPKNFNTWVSDLPKAKYQDQASQVVSNANQQVRDKRFGHLSQQKLRQIVKAKQLENSFLAKKLRLKKISTESTLEHYESVRSRIRTQHLVQGKLPQVINQQKNHLPRINKIYSQAVNHVDYNKNITQNHNKVQQILKRMKDVEQRKYAHDRPVWWG